MTLSRLFWSLIPHAHVWRRSRKGEFMLPASVCRKCGVIRNVRKRKAKE